MDTGKQELSLEHRIELSAAADAPVYFLVHGRAGMVDVMWTFRRSLPALATVISVQAPVADSKGGYSWWSVDEEITDESIATGVRLLDSFIEEAITAYSLQSRRKYGLGFSQGAGVLSVLVQQKPDLFQKVALLAGFVIEQPGSPLEVENSFKPKFLLAHGSEDTVVPLSRAQEGREFLAERGVEVVLVIDPVGHKVGSQGMRAIKEFFL